MAKKTYKFRVCLNPYNPHTSYVPCGVSNNFIFLSRKSPVSSEIEFTYEGTPKDDEFIHNLKSSIASGNAIIVGDIPFKHNFNDETIKYLKSLSTMPAQYQTDSINISVEYSKFIDNLSDRRK